MASKSATTAGAAASAAAASAFVPGATGDDDNNDDVDIPIAVGIQLVADPPFVASAFSRLDPDRFDRIFLYDRQPKKKKGRGDRASDGDVDDAAASSRRRDGDGDVVDDEKNGLGHGRGAAGGDDRSEIPRYTVTVVDRGIIAASSSSSSSRHGTVAFLIPAGREAEFMFSTRPGLRAVVESANCDRLLAIATGRGHAFAGGSAQIQQELQRVCQIVHYRRGGSSSANRRSNSRTAASSSRSSRNRNNQSSRAHEHDGDDDNDTDESSHMIPFVTTSEGVGEREIVARGHSEVSGEYVVEQVRVSASDDDGDGGDHDGGATTVARRLYFLSNPFVIQSEVCLRQNSATIDATMVAFEYHRAMVSCLAGALWRQKEPGPPLAMHDLDPTDGDHAFAPSDAPPPTIPPQGLLLGLGGGGLLHHARCVLPRTSWTAVELDPEVACIAREHFGVEEMVRSGYVDVRIGNALDVRCCESDESDESDDSQPTSIPSDDGLAFAAHSLSFIVVDVDAKDNTIGMSCPPSEFVSEGYLRTLAGLLVRPSDDDDDTGATRDGMLVVNVSARDPSLFHEACRSLRAVFPHVIAASPGDDSINVVVVASLRELPFAAVWANASASSLIPTTSQQPPTLDGPTGSDDAVPPSDLSEEELRRLFDDVRVWDPLVDQSEARAINISSSSSSNKKNNSKKKKGKSGKKKR
jgi:hypothetical protein